MSFWKLEAEPIQVTFYNFWLLIFIELQQVDTPQILSLSLEVEGLLFWLKDVYMFIKSAIIQTSCNSQQFQQQKKLNNKPHVRTSFLLMPQEATETTNCPRLMTDSLNLTPTIKTGSLLARNTKL